MRQLPCASVGASVPPSEQARVPSTLSAPPFLVQGFHASTVRAPQAGRVEVVRLVKAAPSRVGKRAPR